MRRRCLLCGYQMPAGKYRMTGFEFRDDGITFVAVKVPCWECGWWDVVVEHYGPSVWRNA